MFHVRTRLLVFAIVAMVFSGIPAFSQQPKATTPARAAELDAILDAWAQQSSQIKTLSAKFVRRQKRIAWSTMEFRYDVIWKDSGQAVLNIDQVARKDKTEAFDRIVWTGREVWQYNPRKKEIEVSSKAEVAQYEIFRGWITASGWGRLAGNMFDVIFPTLANPKYVEPLPFVIGVKDIVAKKLFQFELVDDSDPERIRLRATPLKPELQALFNDILITLDRKRFVPIAIDYERDWKGRDSRHYTFLDINLNPSLADSTFEPRKPSGWVIKEDDRQAESAPANGQ
jgi:outer membrane lipoprotein-sorting protein